MNGAEHPDLPADALLRFDHPPQNVTTGSGGNSVSRLVLEKRRLLSATARKPRARKRTQLVPVVLVDRSSLFRAGLRQILNGSRFQVTADCSSVQDVPESSFGEGKSAAVIGLERDVQGLLHRIRALKDQHPELRIVMLQDRMDADQVVAAIESGVDGYLLRDEVKPETILKSLEMILADGIVVPPGFAKLMTPTVRSESNGLAGSDVVCRDVPVRVATQIDIKPSPLPPVAPLDIDLARLSERERLILSHLTLGASNKLIARKLDVAEATVKAHVKSLLRKLRVNNRTQAAMWAISRGASSDGLNID